MEQGAGMVAIVRGLRDSGLAVTLLDSGKQYSLVPNSSLNSSYGNLMARGLQQRSTATDVYSDRLDRGLSCDCAAQVTDGRYASIYKIAHCKVEPTSPPVMSTEFPPQRPEVCHGHENFVIGGAGSGDNTHSPVQANSSYRVGMSWPERGSVSAPRVSRESHAFANSLRKYPTISPERSSEIVERLINYTQAKNFSKTQSRLPYSTSPTRLESCPEQVEVERNYPRNTASITKPQKNYYESENIKSKCRDNEESPTRERSKKDCEYSEYKTTFCKNYDVRQLRDISKIVRGNLKSMPNFNSYTQAVAYPSLQDGYNNQDHRRHFENLPKHNVQTQVDTETQASTHMVCKDVSTSAEPSKRNVAVPLSPSPSEADHEQEGGVSHPNSSPNKCKCAQTSRLSVPLPLPLKMRKSVETSVSFCEIARSRKKYTNCRKSKSGDEMRTTNKKELQDEILVWLDNIFQNYNQNRVFREDVVETLSSKLGKLSKDRENTKVKVKRRYKNVAVTNRDCDGNRKRFEYCPCDSNECEKEHLRHKHSTKLYFSLLNPEDTFSAKNYINDVIKNWVKNIPTKKHDNGRHVNKEQLLADIAAIFAEMNLHDANCNQDKLKSDVINKLMEINIEVPKSCTKTIILDRLADRLIDKLQNCTRSNCYCDRNKNDKKHCPGSSFKIHIQPTENELKNFIKNEMTDFFEKFQINISSKVVEKTENELVDILLDSMEAIRSNNDEHVIQEIKASLCDSDTVFEYQGLYLAKLLFGHFKTMYNIVNNKELTFERPIQTETVMVLQNTTQLTQPKTAETSEDVSIEAILVRDLELNIDLYMKQLSQQIDNWLTNLHVQVPQSHDGNFRQIVVNDLAEDIVDRLRYLEFKISTHGSDQDELEHLKFQIFKWINKLVGEDNMETISHASDLMDRIRSIPVPTLTRTTNSRCCKTEVSLRQMNSNSKPDSFQSSSMAATDALKINQMPMLKSVEPGSNTNKSNGLGPLLIRSRSSNQAELATGSQFRNGRLGPSRPIIAGMSEVGNTPDALKNPASALRPPGACSLTPCMPSLKELNDEFDLFIKSWVQQIPIQHSTPEEEALTEKMRQGLYNGIWKAIAKIKSQPQIMINPFYYEDVLDDEIEQLFLLIPESSEFLRQKQILKVKLLEKVTDINEQIKVILRPDTFKQKLVDSVEIYVPRLTTDVRDEDPIKQFEELTVLYFVDDYILFKRYKDEDPVKANVYRKKLLERIQSLVDEIKRTHGRELQEIDKDMYMNDIISALEQVPLPSDETIREEANEILLGLEIEQWYSDLPMARNDDLAEQMKRRRLLDALTKRIHDMEKCTSFANNTDDRALRSEVSRFLKKVPLGRDESLNINFMVDELANRLKNRHQCADAEPSEKTKYVLFEDSITYNDFGNNIPATSSLIERNSMINDAVIYAFDQPCCRPPQPCCPPEVSRQWQSGGQSTNVSNAQPNVTGMYQSNSYINNTEDLIFHTLDETRMPVAMRNNEPANQMYVPQGQASQIPYEIVRSDSSQWQSGRPSSFQPSYPQSRDNTEFLTLDETRMPSMFQANPADMEHSSMQQYETGWDKDYSTGMKNASQLRPAQYAVVQDPAGFEEFALAPPASSTLNYEPGQQTSENQNLSGQIKRPCQRCQNSSKPCQKCHPKTPKASNFSAVPLQTYERQDQIPSISGGPPTGRQNLSGQDPQIYARPVSPATVNQIPAQSSINTSMPGRQSTGRKKNSGKGPQISFAPVSQMPAQIPIYPSEPTGQMPRPQNLSGQGPQIPMRPQSLANISQIGGGLGPSQAQGSQIAIRSQSPANVSQMPAYVSGAQVSMQRQHSQIGGGIGPSQAQGPQMAMRPQSPANVSQMPGYVPGAQANLQDQIANSQIGAGIEPRQTSNVIERNISPGRTHSGSLERGVQAQMRAGSPAIKSYQSSAPVPTRQVSDACQQIPENNNSSRHARFDHPLRNSLISAYNQQPVGFSTPQEQIQQGGQPKPIRKSTRGPQQAPGEADRRRLDFDDSEEETDGEREMRIRCRCLERLRRSKRRRPVYYCEDYDFGYTPCLPMTYYDPRFY